MAFSKHEIRTFFLKMRLPTKIIAQEFLFACIRVHEHSDFKFSWHELLDMNLSNPRLMNDEIER